MLRKRHRKCSTEGSKISRSDRFCNNIIAYHKKSGEEQFYDFTIKDKQGAQIRAHKFILASQSEYFAALFRRDPTASETTFQDFSIDAIKECIEYLYVLEVNLTGSNVQDVIMFADYITLTGVIDICTDYIIKNIDQANYANVIKLGDRLKIDKLVEEGALFTARNFASINNFDEFTNNNTKEIIMKFADRQLKLPVTVMTTEQWKINRLKKFLLAPEEEIIFQARGSSVYANNPLYWEPKMAIDGEISHSDYHYFHSDFEMNPWLEVKFPCPVLISSVTIVNRWNGCWGRLRNVEIRAGMSPVPEGFTAHERGINSCKKLEVNSRCGYFAGPASGFIPEGHVIMFDQPTFAQYITLQILETGYLQINGLKINGGVLLNFKDRF